MVPLVQRFRRHLPTFAMEKGDMQNRNGWLIYISSFLWWLTIVYICNLIKISCTDTYQNSRFKSDYYICDILLIKRIQFIWPVWQSVMLFCGYLPFTNYFNIVFFSMVYGVFLEYSESRILGFDDFYCALSGMYIGYG